MYISMRVRKSLCLLILALCAAAGVRGQNVAVKTNLLYDAAANVNAGIEIGLAPRWSLDLSGNYNRWTINEHKWKHWFVQPEVRYWFCDRFAKHFVALHAIGGDFNFGNIRNNVKFLGSDFSMLSDHRYQGRGIGAGLAYGYALPIGYHWNLEFELGVGYIYVDYDRYECQGCGRKAGSDHHNYVGPTKAAVNLVYLF